MKVITKDIDYAMRAIMELFRKKDHKMNITQLVKITKISPSFLKKIMQALAKKNIIDVHKGRSGGFSLKNQDVTMYDITACFAGKMQLNDHMFNGKKCPKFTGCNCRKEFDAIEKELKERFQGIKIATLV
jgi:Rrf2 family protein